MFVKNEKFLIGKTIDSLDLLEKPLAKEIEKIKEMFNAMNSAQKSKCIIDKVQGLLRAKFGVAE